jgi:hypothetical protein
MRVPTVFAAAGLILVVASATACSGGSKTAAGAPTASTGPATASSSAATGNAGMSSSVKSFDVCSALPAAAASQITGTTFTAAKSSDAEGLVFSYVTADQGKQIVEELHSKL